MFKSLKQETRGGGVGGRGRGEGGGGSGNLAAGNRWKSRLRKNGCKHFDKEKPKRKPQVTCSLSTAYNSAESLSCHFDNCFHCSINSLFLSCTYLCRLMSILLSVNCPPGTYSDSHGNTCVECNPGFYQDQEGMTECQPCPKSYSHIITGSKSSDDCKRKMSIVGFDNSWNSVIWNLTVVVSCQTNLIFNPSCWAILSCYAPQKYNLP